MAWLGEGLSSLSSLKGQITNFTKEVLSDGIVNEIDDSQTKDLENANAKCDQLQELLNSKEAEISILRKQNSELQKAVVEFRSKTNDTNNDKPSDDDGGAFFWDPQPQRSKESRTKQLQDQLDRATVRIRELEHELSRSSNLSKEANIEENDEGSSVPGTEISRAKQDVINRIVQIGEKSQNNDVNESIDLVDDLRAAISKLSTNEQRKLIKSAIMALNEELVDDDVKTRTNGESGRFDDLNRRIEELEAENRSLATSMDELDRQNAESIERVLSLKEELQKKHHSLQSAYEHLYVDYNQATLKIEQLQRRSELNYSTSSKETLDSAVQTNVPIFNVDASTSTTNNKTDKVTETTTIGKENKEIEAARLDNDDAEESRKAREILEKGSIELNADDSSSLLVSLAKRATELKWQLDALGHKFTEQCRELKETQDTREALQLDCDDLQRNVDALLVEVQHLKSNLPSIPEASEERVASLETETESLQDEIRGLRDDNAIMKRELRAIRDTIAETSENERLLARIEAALLAVKKSNGRELINDNDDGDDPAESLAAALNENTSLRRRIDAMESELRVSLERCNGMDENLELIEELKLDLDNARRELKIVGSCNKRLENSLSIAQETRHELELDNEVLARDKEQLEADLKLLRESDFKRDDGEALAIIRDQLTRALEEKNDLDYDIKEMRRELDRTLDELETIKGCADELRAENDRLAKVNDKLRDQYADAQSESQDKIELINTEMVLLQQELDGCRDELVNALKLAEDRASTLESDNEPLAKLESYGAENARLIDELERRVRELNETKDELRMQGERMAILEDESATMRGELRRTGDVDAENQRLIKHMDEKRREIFAKDEAISRLETALKCAETYASTLESEHKFLEDELAGLEVRVKGKQRSTGVDSRSANEQCADNEKNRNEDDEIIEIADEANSKLNAELDGGSGKLTMVDERDVDVETISSDELMIRLDEKSKEIEILRATITKDEESAAMARETVENLSQLVSAKDSEIVKINESYGLMNEERNKIVKLVQDKHAESLQYHAEIQRLTRSLSDQEANLQKIIAERDANATTVQEKETQLLWTRNELEVMKQRLQSMEATSEDCIVPEHVLLVKRMAELDEKNKNHETTIIQQRASLRQIQEQLVNAQSNEASALKEVERLRNHLVDIEANYTEEALQTEEIRNTLESRLMQAEEKLKNSSTIYTSASVRANQQVETLQQQLALIVKQRDDLQNKISAAEDKVLSYTASLTNLQLVLEQFQRDKEQDIEAATDRLRTQLQESYEEQERLRGDIKNLKTQLMEAKDALQAASRLTEELERKSERIEQLDKEVTKLTELVSTADERIEEAKKSGEGKVDKALIKNLLLGYISSPTNDKMSVLKVCANVLDFNQSEREKSGLNSGSDKNSWFSSLVNSGSASNTDQETSLSAAFIKFLENESRPKPQLPELPIPNLPINRPGHSRQNSSSSTQSSLLLTNVNLPTFPDFVPARNTGSILKEVLRDS